VASFRQPRTNLSNSYSPSFSGTSPSVPSTHHPRHASPLHSFISRLKLSFSANPSHRSLPFYRAMLCIRSTSHVSVRLSVTSRSSTKTAKRRITKTKPHDSPETLVFWCQRPPRNSIGITPCGGAKCRWGGSKSATFDK